MAQHLCGAGRCLLNPCSTTHNIFVREPLAIFHQVTWVYMVFYRKPHNTLSKIDFLSNLYCWFIIIELSQQHCPSHLNKVCLMPSFPIRYTIVFLCWRTSENTLVSCLESLLNCKSTNKKAQKKGMLKKGQLFTAPGLNKKSSVALVMFMLDNSQISLPRVCKLVALEMCHYLLQNFSQVGKFKNMASMKDKYCNCNYYYYL